MKWYESILPPFREGKKRKEFPDAFAIAILEVYAKKNNCVIAVVSYDADFKLACDRFPCLLYFNSLPALTELLLADADQIEGIRTAVLSDVSVLEESVAEAARGILWLHERSDYNVADTNIYSASITDVRVVAIGADECTLTFEAEIEAEHDLEWEELDHDRDEQVTEEQTVIETTKVSGTAKVSLDVKKHEIHKVTLLSLDKDYIEVTENPRHRW